MEKSIQFHSNSNPQVSTDLSFFEDALNRFFSGDFTGSNWRGWLQDRGCALESTDFAKDLKEKVDFDCIVNVGIGGSYLGCRAVYEALENYSFSLSKKFKPIFFAGHQTDSQYHSELFSTIKSKFKPVFVIISKSGSTRETALATERIVEEFSYLKDFEKRVIAVTELTASSSLYSIAKKRRWITFPVPEDVGGRYSLMTHAATVPLALAGVDVMDLSRDFYSALKSFSDGNIKSLIAYVRFRYDSAAAGKAIEILSYSQPKHFFIVEWLRQLYAESECKNSKGVMPVGMAYSTDLHSLGQLVQEGERNLFQTFLTFAGSKQVSDNPFEILTDKILEASQLAHEKGGVPCAELKIGSSSPNTHLGAFFAFSMVSCAVYCIARGVNPFDQPGVEVYKAELKAIF